MDKHNIYKFYKDDLKNKDSKYKKLAVLNYVLSASYMLINLLLWGLFFISKNLSALFTFVVILQLINAYFVNILITLLVIVNSILQYKVTNNIHSKINIGISLIILLLTTINIILL